MGKFEKFDAVRSMIEEGLNVFGFVFIDGKMEGFIVGKEFRKEKKSSITIPNGKDDDGPELGEEVVEGKYPSNKEGKIVLDKSRTMNGISLLNFGSSLKGMVKRIDYSDKVTFWLDGKLISKVETKPNRNGDGFYFEVYADLEEGEHLLQIRMRGDEKFLTSEQFVVSTIDDFEVKR